MTHTTQNSPALRFTEDVGDEHQHTVRLAESGFPVAVLTNYRRIEREALARQFAGSSELLDAAYEALEICRLYGGPQLPRLFQAVAAIRGESTATSCASAQLSHDDLVIVGSDAELCECVGNDECNGACRVYGKRAGATS